LELPTLLKCYIIELPQKRKRLRSACSEASFSFKPPTDRELILRSPHKRERG